MTIYKLAISVNVSAQGLGRTKLDHGCSWKKMWVASVSNIVSRMFPYTQLHFIDENILRKHSLKIKQDKINLKSV